LPIVLLRIDERLIHGQVVIGWGGDLTPDRYVVADDELAESEWEQDLYRLGAGGAETIFVGVDEARARLDEWRSAPQRSIVLTRSVANMRRLAEGGLLKGESVNVGGVHHAPGREEVLSYLHVSEEELRGLQAIAASGAEVSARDLPEAHRVSLSTLLGGKWKSP